MGQIKAEIVAHSLNMQGDELVSVLVTFPRIILSELLTHRMLSKNTSSSRAIPFKKMVESVQNDPFIPIAWQKAHSGMQGTEYHEGIVGNEAKWLKARNVAIEQAEWLDKFGVTKQLCNRLLEPFMWTTMLITGSKEGWDNFFELRCPRYYGVYKSQKELLVTNVEERIKPFSERPNESQAEIHIQVLAEKIYDAVNKSTPEKLESGQWHIPFEDKINELYPGLTLEDQIKVSVGMAANTSYTVVGDGSIINLEKATRIHDKCKELNHSSVFEHCARSMSNEEYVSFIKGNLDAEIDADGYIDISTHINNHNSFGWCRNFKGFIPYRHIIETEKYGDI